MDKQVNEYIEKQQSPFKEICKRLREIIIETFPSINERMKYGVPYYNDKYYYVALKNHVNLGFSIKNLTSEEISLFEGGGKEVRHIKIKSLDSIDENRIKELLNLIDSKH